MKILEIAMEIAQTPEVLEQVRSRFGARAARDLAMSTSVGGIGPLLRERIVAQAERGAEVVGVSLLYDSVWIQSWFDWGQLHLEKREAAIYARQQLQDTGMALPIPLFDGTTVTSRVWLASYGGARVYFLDCPPLTHVVYPSEEDAPATQASPASWAEDLRHRQSWLVGRGALALAKAISFKPDLVVLSETPTIFGHARLAQDGLQQDPWFDHTRYIFNDHTPLEYAHPVWPPSLIDKFKLDTAGYTQPAGWADHGQVDITRLLISRCDGAFGVSQKHGRVMRNMPSLKEYASKIHTITNGILPDYWQAPDYRSHTVMTDSELLKVRQQRKSELLDWVWRTYGLWHTWKDGVRGKAVAVWTRRLTGYKRMDLLLGLCRNPAYRRQFLDADLVLLIGGRIHQHDDQSQANVYNLLDILATDRALQERIVFLDNFNVGMAPHLFQGADASIMLADDGREASATGFMKAQVNGQIIIATDDGAIPESVVFMGREKAGQSPNGIEVPYVQAHPTAEGLIQALRTLAQIIRQPEQHLRMVRAAFAATAQVSVYRTAEECLRYYQDILARSSSTPEVSPPAAVS